MINNIGFQTQNINAQPVQPQVNQAVQTNPIKLNQPTQQPLSTQFNNYVPQVRTKLTFWLLLKPWMHLQFKT